MIDVAHIEIAKLELQPGDMLVLRVPPDWTPEQQDNASQAVKTAMRIANVNAPILVGKTDVEFQIIRRGEAA
jgi:hypothetical protein